MGWHNLFEHYRHHILSTSVLDEALLSFDNRVLNENGTRVRQINTRKCIYLSRTIRFCTIAVWYLNCRSQRLTPKIYTILQKGLIVGRHSNKFKNSLIRSECCSKISTIDKGSQIIKNYAKSWKKSPMVFFKFKIAFHVLLFNQNSAEHVCNTIITEDLLICDMYVKKLTNLNHNPIHY